MTVISSNTISVAVKCHLKAVFLDGGMRGYNMGNLFKVGFYPEACSEDWKGQRERMGSQKETQN